MKKIGQLLGLIFLIGSLGACSVEDSATDVTSSTTKSKPQSVIKKAKTTTETQTKMDFDDAVNQLIVESNGELIGVAVTPTDGVDELTIRLQDAFTEKPKDEQLRLCEMYQGKIMDAYKHFYLPEHPGDKKTKTQCVTESNQPIAVTDDNQEDSTKLVLEK